ncbi:hypothetical protein BGZ97_002692 [Linnemannia gamsii]|uniref:Uncharacterized protein n=1 Tax=Linnemannia gamsii TaxID=64522 RepID=A0A9P6RJT5_9FUNG|nr:hypothetical protein BGZ97_002692 [Linnemannia gamsii]
MQLFALLERCNEQIGSLSELEQLVLRLRRRGEVIVREDAMRTKANTGTCMEEDIFYNYQGDSFPGMLSLGNKRGQRPGYLHLFAGLIKLKEPRGSVYADNQRPGDGGTAGSKVAERESAGAQDCRVFDSGGCPKKSFTAASQDAYIMHHFEH